MPTKGKALWVFGYGSLIWRPDFVYKARRRARLFGWTRRFWQGSHDHRGLPHAPGRVVTLIPDAGGWCDGIAYLIDPDVATAVFVHLDHREKNGYERRKVPLWLDNDEHIEGVVYIATPTNRAYLGPAPVGEIAQQIVCSRGPSGHNLEYLFELAHALRALDADDPHVFELESAARGLGAP